MKEKVKGFFAKVWEGIKAAAPHIFMIGIGLVLAVFSKERYAKTLEHAYDKGKQEELNRICNAVDDGAEPTFTSSDGGKLTITKKAAE